IANITFDVGKSFSQTKLVKERRFCVGRESVAGDIGPEFKQPFGEPRAFETGVASEENFFAAKRVAERVVHVHQIFHGAFPSAHIWLSKVNYWNVSIGWQNPL